MSKRFEIIFCVIELAGVIVGGICSIIQTAREKEIAKITGREAGKAVVQYSEKLAEEEAKKKA